MTVSPKKTPLVATQAPVTQSESLKLVAPLALATATFEAGKIFESAAAPAREVQENLRKAAEMGVTQSKAAYAKVKTVAEDATQSLEASYAAAVQGVAALNAKAVDAVRANVDASFGFFKALAGAKSLPEALEVQTGHARKQFEALTFQAKEMATLAQSLAAEAVAPLKAGVNKALAQAN